MSRVNGDKARFHRERKQKIHRRERQREMFSTLANQSTPAAPRLEAKPKAKQA